MLHTRYVRCRHESAAGRPERIAAPTKSGANPAGGSRSISGAHVWVVRPLACRCPVRHLAGLQVDRTSSQGCYSYSVLHPGGNSAQSSVQEAESRGPVQPRDTLLTPCRPAGPASLPQDDSASARSACECTCTGASMGRVAAVQTTPRNRLNEYDLSIDVQHSRSVPRVRRDHRCVGRVLLCCSQRAQAQACRRRHHLRNTEHECPRQGEFSTLQCTHDCVHALRSPAPPLPGADSADCSWTPLRHSSRRAGKLAACQQAGRNRSAESIVIAIWTPARGQGACRTLTANSVDTWLR